MTTAYSHAKDFTNAVDDSKTFEKTLGGLWDSSDSELFNRTLDEIDAAAVDVANAQTKADLASRFDPDHLADRNDAFHAAWIRLDALRARLFEMFKKKPWFKWETFRDEISASVLFYGFAPNLDGILPDPILDEGCYVGFARPDTGLKAGARLTGIRAKNSETVDPVTTWRDVVNWLEKHPEATEVTASYTYLGEDSTTELLTHRAEKPKTTDEGDTHPKSGG